jgi:isopenicillin-N epimerase
MVADLSPMFLLDPEITFLNHGSFGACPGPVFEVYQKWQRRLEAKPVEFLDRQMSAQMAESRARLAAFLNCPPDNLVYFPNPTTAINMVARNLILQPGDEILTTDHEYGALDRTWRYVCDKMGASYVQQAIPLPLTTPEDFVESFWAGVTPRTRVIFISHITSPTALIFPVTEICHRAREAGILCIVDGAHAPGQIPLDLKHMDADIYVGACHKWLMAPKGAAFLFARPEVQGWLDPLVVSWGFHPEPGFGSGLRFVDYHEWQGTRDLAAFLSVPSAIDFQEEYAWEQVRERCYQMARAARKHILDITALPAICPDDLGWFRQMFAVQLPELDERELKRRLYDDYCIEVPLLRWGDRPYLRVSIQGYNTQADIDVLLDALRKLIP